MKSIAADELPKSVDEDTLPFITEMITPGLKDTLSSWLARKEDSSGDAVAATILHACREPLTLDSERPRDLSGARLDGLNAQGAILKKAKLDGASLRGAKLDGADVTGASFVKTDAEGIVLYAATITGARFEADLRGACFRHATSTDNTRFVAARLDGACFDGANLCSAMFSSSSLENATLLGARLVCSKLISILVKGADFSRSSLQDSMIQDVDFRDASLRDVYLRRAMMTACRLGALDLEKIDGVLAKFVSCDLSGTRFHGASLNDATFDSCVAHDVVFDDAELRDSNFTSVNFHAGSSRAGLLLGKPALEGNMTGFYREGTTDDAWASPESIRQASFRGADLRGATFVDTNLFRVDFRGARMDPALLAQARTDGALLD